MQQLKTLLIASLLVLLVGCGKEETPVEVEQPPLHTMQSSYKTSSISANAITPTTAFEEVGDELRLYPFYNSDHYISMKVILISNNDFWNTIISGYTGTNNLQVYDKYSLITTSFGKTITVIPRSSEEAIVISSDTLPSGYVKATADMLCN